MNNSTELQDSSMYTYFKEQCKYITIHTHSFIYDKEDNEYILCMNAFYKKTTGTLTVDFLNSDFSTIKGFKNFIDKWGISGFLKIAYPEKDTFLDRIGYTFEKYNAYINDLYTRCKEELIQSQYDFKEIINIFIDETDDKDFRDLTPIQRFYLKTYNSLSPVSVEKYNSNLIRTFTIFEDDEEARFFHNKEDILNSFKKNKTIVHRVFYTQDIRSLIYLEFESIIDNFTIKKCTLCNKYFVPQNRSDEILCNECRKLDYDTRSKIKGDEIRNLYRRAYKNKKNQEARKLKLEKNEEVIDNIKSNFKTWTQEANKIMNELRNYTGNEKEYHILKFEEFLKKDIKWFYKREEN